MVFVSNDWVIVAPIFLCFLLIFIILAAYTPSWRCGGWYSNIWRTHPFLPAILIYLIWVICLLWLAGAWTDANLTRYNSTITALYTSIAVLIWSWNLLVFGDARFYWSIGIIVLLILTIIGTVVYQLQDQPQWFEILALSFILIWSAYCLVFNIQLLQITNLKLISPPTIHCVH